MVEYDVNKKMTCNYFDYVKMTDSLFYGVALSQEHLNNCFDKIYNYLVHGGAACVADALGIGWKFEYAQSSDKEPKLLRKSFVFIKGKSKGKELSVQEIINIGLFLKHGPYFGKK